LVRSAARARPKAVGIVSTLALAAILAVSAPGAAAAVRSGGAPSAAEAPPPKTSPTGSPEASAPSAGTLTLKTARTTPRRSFYYGVKSPTLRFEIESTQPRNDLRIDVVSGTGEAVRTYYRNDVEPNLPVAIHWDGTMTNRRPAPKGHYSFRISAQAGSRVAARASASTAPIRLGFSFYVYTFPIVGPHEFSMGAGRFGAARAGHTHQGQDVMAECGTPLVAARGGTVQYAGYEGSAGNYVVIDGRGTPYDAAYMHLAEPSLLRTGDPVRTGQPIGIVGETGDATACHLHFELWTGPGWYEGGSPIDPLPLLKKWDKYS
jgi:murein DD-endopeptidase MepM/ murein hydrolase activator NlpD